MREYLLSSCKVQVQVQVPTYCKFAAFRLMRTLRAQAGDAFLEVLACVPTYVLLSTPQHAKSPCSLAGHVPTYLSSHNPEKSQKSRQTILSHLVGACVGIGVPHLQP